MSISLKLNFDTEAEDAANFYTRVLKDSDLIQVTRFPKDREECVTCGIDLY